MAAIVVFGEMVVERRVEVGELPRPGLRVEATPGIVQPAGGALLQSVAAARAGAAVRTVSAVGSDRAGTGLVEVLEASGVAADHVMRVADDPTARLLVCVAPDGSTSEVAEPGATRWAALPSAALEGAAVLVAQLGPPVGAVVAALRAARAAGVTTVLHAAPLPGSLPADELLALADWVVVAEADAAALGEVEVTGVVAVLCRDGSVLVLRPGRSDRRVPASGSVVDPTASADAFCGHLAAALASGAAPGEAVWRAAAAAAWCRQRPGGLVALPTAAALRAPSPAVGVGSH